MKGVIVNVHVLIGEVAKRHNVLLDPKDPVLLTVTLNEILLEESLRRVNAAAEEGERRAIAASEKQLALAKQAAGELVTRTAGYVVDQVRVGVAEASADFERRISTAAEAARANAAATARHRTLAFAFMFATAVATAIALSGVGGTYCSTASRDRADVRSTREGRAAVNRERPGGR